MPKGPYSVLVDKKIKEFNKSIKVDSDKSISIRSFLLSSISNNISEVKNALESEDVQSCINCLKKLGVKIKKNKNKNYLIFGKGLGSLYAKKNTTLNCGNSGTLARLLIGILSTTPDINIVITGDKSLNKRSMRSLIHVMSRFGASFKPENKNHFPLKLISSSMPIGIKYESGTSAQIKSAVILAGLNSYGNTTILEKQKTRNHTENILLNNSKCLKIKNKKNIIEVSGNKNLNQINMDVPSDPSSAAFFVALCLLNKKSVLKIKKVCLNPARIGFYLLLKKYGAKIRMINKKKYNNELIGDILVKSSKIKPIKSSGKYYLSATDEFPIMFVIAALTKGISKFYGIKGLSNKESNRILEMKKILSKFGVKCKSTKDSMIIIGREVIKRNNLIKVDSVNDHRIAMSCFILALISGSRLLIKGFETVKTSSPSFLKTIKLLGGKYEIKKTS